MNTLAFFRVVIDAKNKGLQIDIIPRSVRENDVIVIVASPELEDHSVECAYQDIFKSDDLEGQTDFIEHAVRHLAEYHKR